MQAATNIFITGTNRGLGKELVKLLHHTRPEAKIHISSRNTPEELSQQWEKEIPGHIFATYQIDLNDPTSIAKNVQLARDRNIQFDYIVANAAVGCDYGQVIPSEEVAKSTLFTNVNSTINFIKQFIPLLNKNGRVVVVSSIMGSLDVHHQQFRDRLSNPSITEDEILHIANDYVASAIKKDMGHYHWSAYRTSKALINSWSRFILPYFCFYLRTYLKGNQTAVCLHPGWCQTDMGGKNATLTA